MASVALAFLLVGLASRIMADNNSERKDIPSYMVRLIHPSYTTTFCTGVLIAPRYALTSTQCAQTVVTATIGSSIETYRINKWYVHPNNNFQTLAFDVVVIELNHSTTNRPAKLNFDVLAPGTEVVVHGFDKFEESDEDRSGLHEKVGNTLASVDCVAKDNAKVTDDMVCISGSILCGGGNLGAPATTIKNGEPVVVALVSWFTNHCTDDYTGYARISTAKSFLEPYLETNDACAALAFQRPQQPLQERPKETKLAISA
ncbi:hypothetical protein AC1031_004448 [Aphanomyces cochlioides]|nr:hypothetical protein AC1031_004448 [Aphanomyces cochlioides]